MTSLELCFRELSHKKRIYVESRLSGMNKTASATAAGASSPRQTATKWENDEAVQKALVSAMQISADDVGFSRREAHDLLMSAYHSAESAAEQIAAVRELIKLHGISAPQKVEHEHTHVHEGELHLMTTEELMKLAGETNLTLEGEFEAVPERVMIEDGSEIKEQ